MSKRDDRTVAVRTERYLNGGCPWRDRCVALPPPREDHSVRRVQFYVLAASDVGRAHGDPVDATRSWVQLGAHALPAHISIRFDEVEEHLGGRRIEPHLEFDDVLRNWRARHSGFSEDQPEYDFGSIATTWGQIVVRLKDVVESGGTPNPALS